VGSGVAGLGAAWALSRFHDVTVIEAAHRPGGHANTIDISDGGKPLSVDTGFIVYNARNYPNLTRLFDATGVRTEASDMSFAVSMGGGEFEYRGSPAGLIAQPSNLLRSSYRGMVADILRFNREAGSILGSGSSESTGEFLARQGYGDAFVNDFLLPMVGCIWSSRLEEMLSYPAETLVRFLDNHGLLRVGNRPRWRTVTGGSREYVSRLVTEITASDSGRVRLDSPVTQVLRDEEGVTLRTADGGDERFDQVVLATHADTASSILSGDATARERDILGAFRFQDNEAVLHRDPALMPRRRRVWSSWNYVAEGNSASHRSERVSLTYWMNRLQNLETGKPVFVTLNPSREPSEVVASFDYEHPIYDREAIEAQRALPSIQGDRRTWFAGAWTGFGFHEDGLRSGLAVAAALGAPSPWANEIPVIPANRGNTLPASGQSESGEEVA